MFRDISREASARHRGNYQVHARLSQEAAPAAQFFGSFQLARCDTHSFFGANSLWSPFLVRLQDHQTLDQALIRRYSKPLTCFNSHRLTFQEHAEEASFQVQGVHSSDILSVPACGRHCWRNAESCRKSLATPSTKP